MTIDQAMQLALRQHQGGRLAEAESIYRQIIAQQPNRADALHLLGLIASQMGHHDDGTELIRRAIAIKPDFPEAHNDLGNALCLKGQLDAAVAAFGQAIALNPGYSAAHYNLGNVLRETGRSDDAIAAYRRAVALRPDYPEALNNLGNALKDKRQLDEAIAGYRRALALRFNFPEAHLNLGTALRENGQLDDAMAAFRQAIVLRPQYAEAHSNLGVALRDEGRVDESIAAFRRAMALDPDCAEVHLNLGMMLLMLGDLPQGWAESEWRWRMKESQSPAWMRSRPQWDGADLPGASLSKPSNVADRTIFLYAEQGFGDTIQFARYVPLVAEHRRNVIVAVPPELRRLLGSLPCAVRWTTSDEPLPAFDTHCPLLSLPLAFGTTLQTIPGGVPYLKADPNEIERWRNRLADEPGLKVGLAWAGSPTHKNDHGRSVPLSLLAPLAELHGVSFFSLQKGPGAEQSKHPPGKMKLIDWTPELKDFADTAALIANLDLVISVDTAVAHLAGAMGKPVWTLLPAAADWRWMLDREDSPWYPTMRLFRQDARGEWDEVIERVAEELMKKVHERFA